MTKRIPLPSSGGSYTIDAKGKAKQVEKPTRDAPRGATAPASEPPAETSNGESTS